jgi:O-antigen/teichoic acid export membrane protein
MWRFFKDFMIYGFASIFGKLVAIFLMPIYTSILTKEEYGAMALITSCKGIIDLISNLNIHSGIARDYYEDGIDQRKLVSTGFFSILCISVAICFCMILNRSWGLTYALGLERRYMTAFVLMLLTIPCGSLMSYFSIMTRFKKKPVLFSIGTILQLVVQIGISVYCVVILRTGIMGIFLGLLLSEIFAFCYFGFINRVLIGWHFTPFYIKRALCFAIPTLPAILAGWVDSSVGQIVIGKTISKADLGVYSVGLSLASVFTLVSTALQNVWGPFLYENYKKESFNRDLRKLFTVIIFTLIFISIQLSLFSHEIILFLSNPEYLDACKYVTLLCIPMGVYLLFPIASSGVSISRDTKYIGISYVLGSCMNMCVLYFTIGSFGIIAVPLCLALSRCITYALLYKVSERKISYKIPNYLLFVFIVIVGICFTLLQFNLHFVVRLSIALCACGIMCYHILIKVDIKNLLFYKIKNK